MLCRFVRVVGHGKAVGIRQLLDGVIFKMVLRPDEKPDAAHQAAGIGVRLFEKFECRPDVDGLLTFEESHVAALHTREVTNEFKPPIVVAIGSVDPEGHSCQMPSRHFFEFRREIQEIQFAGRLFYDEFVHFLVVGRES